MNKSLLNSPVSGTLSIEERLEERISKIRKIYRIRYILLTLFFVVFSLFSNMKQEKVTIEKKKATWKRSSEKHQKVILPVLAYIDTHEESFPIEVDLYNENHKLVSKAKLHFIEKSNDIQGTSKAFLEIPEEQVSGIPKQASLVFKIYPHIKDLKKKRSSYEISF